MDFMLVFGGVPIFSLADCDPIAVIAKDLLKLGDEDDAYAPFGGTLTRERLESGENLRKGEVV